MKTEEIALSRVSENEANPREISQANFQKLVQSIIVFPRMLTLRPIVIDETFHALGGNMRLKALQHIVTMDEAGIQVKLDAEQRLSDEEQAALMEYWQGWQQQPTVTVVSASDLTEAQKQEFMIKDNLSFGNWDFNDLANRWDSAQLQNWGMPVWNPAPVEASSTKDGVAFAGRYDVKYGGVDNLNGTTILRDIVKKALESTDCIICEGMRLKCWGPNLTHAMFNADRQIVIFLYAPLEEIQKRLAERSNGTLSKDIIRGQRESAHSAKKWQTAGCDVVAIDTTKQTADQIADFIINKINS